MSAKVKYQGRDGAFVQLLGDYNDGDPRAKKGETYEVPADVAEQLTILAGFTLEEDAPKGEKGKIPPPASEEKGDSNPPSEGQKGNQEGENN